MIDIIYVDESDRIIGSGPISEAVPKGVAVRIARVFLSNKANEILLQKRSASIMASPGKWDQSAGGHVDVGESYLQAANRELLEEMGVANVSLRQVSKFYTEDEYLGNTRKRFNVIFTGSYDGQVNIDHDEVADYKWVTRGSLRDWLKTNPQDFTKGFLMAFDILMNKQNH